MYKTKLKNTKALLVSLLISLGVGALSGILTKNSVNVYGQLNLPPLSPPSWVFPVVWTILFVLMGISSYIIYTSKSQNTKGALAIYFLQLVVNFIWPLIFFGAQEYLFAFIWLIFLWLLVVLMINMFYKISPIAALLQIPYLIWLTFAAYLNLMVVILN
ncbi:MAG: TspO/MBR family protein [Anaerotignaceae bacterium]